MAIPAVDGQTADPSAGDDAARDRQTEKLRLMVDVAPDGPALYSHRASIGVDVDAAHIREVDDQSAVIDGVAGDIVSAAPDGQKEPMLPREVDARDDVGGAGAARDQGRAAVDQAVADGACLVIVRIFGRQQWAAEMAPELLDYRLTQHSLGRRSHHLGSHTRSF